VYTVNAELETGIDDAASASSARMQVRDYCSQQGMSGETLDAFILGVGEAITNAIKHGIRGMVYAGRADSTVWVGVSDEGTGIESLSLPRMVLLRGYSTKPSLGMGYSIMLDMRDRVLLKTDETGTTVILIKNLDTPGTGITLDKLTDSW
jgi:anti-sigma regulatory factor (Ser/Thr protein kinase)